MNPIQHRHEVPFDFARELRTTWSTVTFARRAVFVRDETSKNWVLYGCVVCPGQGETSRDRQRFVYEKVLLVADSLPGSAVEAFLLNVGDELSRLAEVPIFPAFWPGCEIQPVTVQNHWMEKPGLVYSWKPKHQPNPPHEQLLAPSSPYYPDVYEAAKDWLQLREYDLQSDGRKGHLMVLLPETRAYIEDSDWSEDDEHLQLRIAGTAVASKALHVKGAYWRGKNIRQLDAAIDLGAVTLDIRRDADRLELFLMDGEGVIYEQHRETLSLSGEKRFLGSRHGMSSERVADALKKGEGVRIEFKEFVDVPKPKEPIKEKSKFEQVLRTVAAFANTEGGTIFIGIEDDMRVVGVSERVAQWAGGETPSLELISRYMGTLRARITDSMHLPVEVSASVVAHEGRYVVLVDVPASQSTVSLKEDGRLMMRIGANNRKIPPAEWLEARSGLLTRW